MSRICSEMLTKSRRLAERGREGMETIRNTKYLFTCWWIFFLLFVSVSLSELLKADSHRKRKVWRNLAIIKTILSRMSSLKNTQVSFNEVVKTVMRWSLKPGQYKVVKKLIWNSCRWKNHFTPKELECVSENNFHDGKIYHISNRSPTNKHKPDMNAKIMCVRSR